MVKRIQISLLVATFVVGIVTANLITTHYGVGSVYYVAFGLIGLDLITRDRLADFWGTTRWAKMGLLILVGGMLSYWLNRGAATIALASCVAFCTSELIESGTYHALRHRQWSERAPQAATLGAVVDSIAFVSIAFGFSLQIVFLQVCCKIAGAVAWTWIIARLVPPPAMAPLIPEGELTGEVA